MGGTRATGAVHDNKAARTHGIISALEKADVECWAAKGYRRRRHHTAALMTWRLVCACDAPPPASPAASRPSSPCT
ncbi:hypothetical protein GCM10010377_71330 [Streptomyces viridiviolaceus]|nr:hypothetical protein GCM10010377_71330 [Streptomyces viridiviolaceus]